MSGNREIPGSFFGRSGFMSVDQETKQRDPSFKFGIITCDPDLLSVVTNISPTGALLEVNDPLETPDQFTLAIESEPSARACCVAWRKAKQIAVNFDVMRGGAAAQEQDHDGRRTDVRRRAKAKIRRDGSGWTVASP